MMENPVWTEDTMMIDEPIGGKEAVMENLVWTEDTKMIIERTGTWMNEVANKL